MPPEFFEVTAGWKAAFPEAHVGLLVMDQVANPPRHAALEAQKERLENQLRADFAGQDRRAIEALPPIQAYSAYYKRFKKTYHVQLQLESIVFKGKSLPSVAALVEAMFMAEVKNWLLTAGHDLAALRLPAVLNVSAGGELYTLLRGGAQALKLGDMFIADQAGIISSLIYGPDQRTQITASTQSALFTIYAPPGIEAAAIYEHLNDLQANIRLIAPAAQLRWLTVLGTQAS